MKSALAILENLEAMIDSAKSVAQERGKAEFWQRDKAFISTARNCLLSEESERIRWVFGQIRNLSQGFGSYCSDMNELDSLVDKLYAELQQLILQR